MNELVIYQEITLIAKTVAYIARTIRETQELPRRDAERLRVQIETVLAVDRSRALGELSRQNLDEIYKTARKMESYDLNGPALRQCSEQLQLLSDSLSRSMENLTRRIL